MINIDDLLAKTPSSELETVNIFIASLIKSQLSADERLMCEYSATEVHWYYWISYNNGPWLHCIHTYWSTLQREIVIDPAMAYGLEYRRFPIHQPTPQAQSYIRKVLDTIKHANSVVNKGTRNYWGSLG